MASIANAALVLTTESGRMTAGMDKSAQDIRSWTARLNSGLTTAFSYTKTIIAAAMGTAAVALWKGANDRLKELTDQGRKAARIGMDSDLFMSLGRQAKMFGGDAETVDKALFKLAAHLANPPKEFAGAIDALGLRLEDLKDKDVGGAFLEIAEAVRKLPSPAQQAAASLDLFAKAGKDMLPIMQQGKDKIQSLVYEQRKAGLALNNSQMAALESARQEIPKFAQAWEGFKNMMLLAFAPILEIVNHTLKQGLAALQPHLADLSGAILTVFYYGVRGGAAMIDGLNAIGGAFAYVGGLAVQFFSLIIQGWKETANIFAKLPAELGGDKFKGWAVDAGAFEKRLDMMAQDMKQWGAKQFVGEWRDAWDKWFEDALKKKNKLKEAIPIGKPDQLPDADKYQKNEAAVRGSKEANSIEARFNLSSRISAQEKILDAARQQVGLLNRLNGIADAIRANTSRKDEPMVGVV